MFKFLPAQCLILLAWMARGDTVDWASLCEDQVGEIRPVSPLILTTTWGTR